MSEDLTNRVKKLEDRVDHLSAKFDEVCTKIEALDTGLTNKMELLLKRFTDIIDKLTFLDEFINTKSKIEREVDSLKRSYGSLMNRVDNQETDIHRLTNTVTKIAEKNLNETLDNAQRKL